MRRLVVVAVCLALTGVFFVAVGCGGSKSSSQTPKKLDSAVEKSTHLTEPDGSSESPPSDEPTPAPVVTVSGIKMEFTSVSRQSTMSGDGGTDQGDYIVIGCNLTNETPNEIKNTPLDLELRFRNKSTGEIYGAATSSGFWGSVGYYYRNQNDPVLKGGQSWSGYYINNINPNSVNPNPAVSSESDLILMINPVYEAGSTVEVDLAQIP